MYKPKLRKGTNRDRILECIFRNAPISRTDIAELTEITPATTTTTVSELLAGGLVEELGEVASEEGSSGRRRIALGLRADAAYAIGAEFTPKGLAVCIANLAGEIVQQRVLPVTPELADTITETMIREIAEIVSRSGLSAQQLVGIGIAVPGQMDRAESRFVTDQSGWGSFDPGRVRDAFALPLALENNIRCMALGRYLFFPKETPDSFAYFHVGYGMFCANVVDGELFLGSSNLSGEIGHTVVKPDGQRCECGKRGCLQTVASERYLLKNARQLYECGASPLLRGLAAASGELTAEHLARAYVMGDELVTRYLSDALNCLAIATSNLAILMNPDAIFLHGQLLDCPEIRTELMELVKSQLPYTDQDDRSAVKLLPCLPTDGALGGCALALMRCFLQSGPRDLAN